MQRSNPVRATDSPRERNDMRSAAGGYWKNKKKKCIRTKYLIELHERKQECKPQTGTCATMEESPP